MNEFIKRLKDSKALTILLSILIACIMWIYVVNTEDPDIDDTIRNVPITITGQEVLEARGLMITDQSEDDLDLRLTGKRNALVNLNETNIPITADVSSITAAGSHELRCTVTLPSTGGSVTVNNRETYRVTVTVENRIKKTVEIRGTLSGGVAKGYQGGEFALSPSSIEIAGPASLIETIEYARVNLTGNNLKETYSGLLPIELVSTDGQIIDIDEVECPASSVYTVYPIVMVREVDLTVNFIAGGGASGETVSHGIFPEKITVSGAEEDLSDLKEISLGEIDLAEISGNSVILMPIELPAGLKNETGTEEAKVTVQFEGLSTKSVEVPHFELTNIPEGWSAEMLSTSIQVIVRGFADAVGAVGADQVRVEVDLSGITPEAGEMEVPAEVSLPQTDGAGVVGNYSVRVVLTR